MKELHTAELQHLTSSQNNCQEQLQAEKEQVISKLAISIIRKFAASLHV